MLLPSQPETSHIKRILLVRTDRLGDVILTLPMLPALRKCFPDAYIAMLLRRYTGEVLVGNPYVDELIWYDENSELVPLREMVATLRAQRFDAVIVVYPRFRLAWLMWRSRIPLRIGTGYRYYSFLFNKKVFEHRKDAQRHELEYNLNLLSELNCGLDKDFSHDFFVAIPEEAELRADEVLKSVNIHPDNSFVIVHPGSGGSAREWSAENFGALAARFVNDENVAVVVTGSSGEKQKVADVVAASGGRAIPLAGKLSIKELGAVMRRAKLFVSNSTGTLHLAVAMGTPVIGFFPQHTPMSAKRWGPYTEKKVVFIPQNRPLDCNVCVEATSACQCMATISVEHVFREAVSLMKKHENKNSGALLEKN